MRKALAISGPVSHIGNKDAAGADFKLSQHAEVAEWAGFKEIGHIPKAAAILNELYNWLVKFWYGEEVSNPKLTTASGGHPGPADHPAGDLTPRALIPTQ